MNRDRLALYLADLLSVGEIQDYCPNGLQIEGKSEIQRVIGGVTASLRLITAAIDAGADALLVHHGFFWKGESAAIRGMKARRIGLLLKHDINLFAYHLPLDVHPQLGNNAGLAQCLCIHDDTADKYALLRCGHIAPVPVKDFIATVERTLHRPPLHLPGGGDVVERICWCTGAAQDMIDEAAAKGAHLFISGEASERTTHAAAELGIHYLSCGHHATETFGVRKLGEHLTTEQGIDFQFLDLPNPV